MISYYSKDATATGEDCTGAYVGVGMITIGGYATATGLDCNGVYATATGGTVASAAMPWQMEMPR